VLRYLVVAEPELGSRPTETKLVYLPFWRLSALLYSCDIGKRQRASESVSASGKIPLMGRGVFIWSTTSPSKLLGGRVVERHLADSATTALGVASLRLRGAIYPVEPFRQEHEGRGEVVAPTLDYEVVREALYRSAIEFGYSGDNIRLECQRADIVAERLSLLYYPFWVRRAAGSVAVWDAVSGEPEPLHESTAAPSVQSSPAFDELTLVELRCGGCQSPLAPGNRTVVYPCHECHTFWVAERDGLRPFEAHYARPLQRLDSGEEPIWLPFWRVECRLGYWEKTIRTVGELRSKLGIRPLPADVGAGADAGKLAYFVAAYGALRAPRLDHAARDLTRLQPELTVGEYQKGEEFRCFYAPSDAHELAYASWLQLIPGAIGKRLRSLRVQVGLTELWYLPFGAKGRELRSLTSGRRYERSAFRGVGH
jgi:tRNA threonylcarbamoyladenosine modification (KEOPS) complex  Pcc1 subunit